MWVNSPTGWRNVYFDTETMGYPEGGKCKWMNNHINPQGPGDSSVGEELAVQA